MHSEDTKGERNISSELMSWPVCRAFIISRAFCALNISSSETTAPMKLIIHILIPTNDGSHSSHIETPIYGHYSAIIVQKVMKFATSEATDGPLDICSFFVPFYISILLFTYCKTVMKAEHFSLLRFTLPF